MLRKILYLTLLVLLGLAVAGCPSPTEPEEESKWLQESYYPHKDGYSWTYVSKDADGNEISTSTETINGTQTEGGKEYQKFTTTSTSSDGSTGSTTILVRVDSEEVVQFLDLRTLGGNKEEGTLIKFGAKTWSGEFSISGQTFKLEFEIQGNSTEKVSVEAGSFDSYKVKFVVSTSSSTSLPIIPSTSFLYYADGVGLVKRESVDENNKITGTKELESKNF